MTYITIILYFFKPIFGLLSIHGYIKLTDNDQMNLLAFSLFPFLLFSDCCERLSMNMESNTKKIITPSAKRHHAYTT